VNTSDVLNRAADIIQERGWVQGGAGWFVESLPADAPLCAQGALRAACHEATDDHREWYRLYFDVTKPIVAAHVGEPIVFSWNDKPGRTAGEVIEALRACALIEAAREEQDAAWATYAELVSA
jgi:hypothetical protein